MKCEQEVKNIIYPDGNKNNKKFSSHDRGHSKLMADCENCFGFCCVALYFSASEGFPSNKEAGKPCPNLQSDFRCKVHKDLSQLGFKGCVAYECFGAGQKVAQVTYGGQDWKQVPQSAKPMFDVFFIMKQLHEMLWYLIEALELESDINKQDTIQSMIIQTERISYLDADSLLNLDLAVHRAAVNALLTQISERIRNRIRGQRETFVINKKTFGRRLDLIGADLRGVDLRGENLGGAYLIAADLQGVDLTGTDLIGADLRDADLRGADLSRSIFLTQAQINTARGDSETKLPRALVRPDCW